MTRPDLKPEFDGWQVVDPTPQEKSEGDSPVDINYLKACSRMGHLIIALNNSGSFSHCCHCLIVIVN